MRSECRLPAVPPDSTTTAATSHGTDRYSDGFDLNALVAEYRALRASVIRLWTPQAGAEDRERQLSRFNEAIDQALKESVFRYSEEDKKSRELFLGVLGHDLRTPLGAALNSAQYLLHSKGLSGEQLKASAGPDVEPHPQLVEPKPATTDPLYECKACGTRWSYHSQNGWKA
jgi:signal transduction histidine kinase